MTFQELFEQVKMEFRKADVSGVKEHLAFQFNITGEAAGSFYAEVRAGKWTRWPHLPWAGLRWTEISEKR